MQRTQLLNINYQMIEEHNFFRTKNEFAYTYKYHAHQQKYTLSR